MTGTDKKLAAKIVPSLHVSRASCRILTGVLITGSCSRSCNTDDFRKR